MTETSVNEYGDGGEDSGSGGQQVGRGTGQPTLHHFFPSVSSAENERHTQRECRAHERRMKRGRRYDGEKRGVPRSKQHKQDGTMGITTQNVRGLATHMTNLATKYTHQHTGRPA
jgi:hypothetical protein